MPDKSRQILYLSVPESLRGKIEDIAVSEESGFSIDPGIPLPVEISNDSSGFDLEDLSWEMIIAGMLNVIAAGEANSEWIDYYRRFVLTIKPNILAEFSEAAILKAKNGDFDLSLEILDALRGMFPFSPAVSLNHALVLEQQAALLEKQGNAEAESAFGEAEAAYAKLLAHNPPFPPAQYNAGFFYLGKKNFIRAKECFSLYLESCEDQEKKEKIEAIIADIEKNNLDDENFREAHELIRQGDEEAGMLYIRDFIEKFPDVWNGWFMLGWALRRLCRWQDGAAAFSKALELGGASADIRNELAICLMELGDLNGARRQLEAALRGDPENVKIISNLAVIALRTGNLDEAAAFFRTVLELAPGDPVAMHYFENI